jgi:hypothetical protein
MSHLPQALDNIAANDPAILKIKKIPVGLGVVYHGRIGSMRQGRTTFPATVLKQHPDDGSIDLLVFFEAEDMIWEQRVRPWTEEQPGHCWSPVEHESNNGEIAKAMEQVKAMLHELRGQMYGDFDTPDKSMIEYLADFDKRLNKLESKLRK